MHWMKAIPYPLTRWVTPNNRLMYTGFQHTGEIQCQQIHS